MAEAIDLCREKAMGGTDTKLEAVVGDKKILLGWYFKDEVGFRIFKRNEYAKKIKVPVCIANPQLP